MTVTKEFAVKIDTELSELHNQRWAVCEKIVSAKDSLEFYQKHYPVISRIMSQANSSYLDAGQMAELAAWIDSLDAL